MANKPRFGLDYFAIPVDLFRRPSVELLKKRYGSAGVHAFISLQASIFAAGSYLRFSAPEEISNLIEKETDADEDTAISILNHLIKYKMFDPESFQKGYLTNVEIQKHYYFATKQRKIRIQPECWLLSIEDMEEIDGGAKYSKAIMTNDNDILTDENGIVVGGNKQSNSKTNSKSNSNKIDEYDELDKRISELPFKPCYSFKVLLREHIITGYEHNAKRLNEFLKELESLAGSDETLKEDIDKSLYYSIRQVRPYLKHGEVEDVCSYVINAIDHNLKCIIHAREHPLWEGLSELLEEYKKQADLDNTEVNPSEDDLGSTYTNSDEVNAGSSDDSDDELPF